MLRFCQVHFSPGINAAALASLVSKVLEMTAVRECRHDMRWGIIREQGYAEMTASHICRSEKLFVIPP